MASNYTFADLLHIFFRFQQDPTRRINQEDLAREVGVALRTINNWFTGNYLPREPELVIRLARALALTRLQADLMLYTINTSWVRYGTPTAVLDAFEVVRYREDQVTYQSGVMPTNPSPEQLEADWTLAFHETFVNNHNSWGLGTKNDNACQITREIRDGQFVLGCHTTFHSDSLVGGDSHCFAPAVYYFSVRAKMAQGITDDDGPALIFEEISDGCHAMLRIRERMGVASVFQVFNGGGNNPNINSALRNDGQNVEIYVNRAPAPMLRKGDWNKLAIAANGNDHWFFINNILIAHRVINRMPITRLDVGVTAGPQQHVICHFQDFRVYVPRAELTFPELTRLNEQGPDD